MRPIVAFIVCCMMFGPLNAFADEVNSLDLFEQRILPILKSPKPSSCSECHLSGVDLKQYIHPSQEKTFASLVSAGLVNTDEPSASKLLTFIRRQPDKPSLVTAKVREQELAAFEAWITAAAADPELLAAKDTTAPVGPQIPPEVIAHARRDRVFQSFLDNVWVEAARCANCHSADRNQRQVERWGEQMSWIKPGDPQATLAHILEYELLDTKNPAESLLVTKPTMQVKHGGGKKTSVGDRTYTQFRRFIDDYAATKNGDYAKAEELPRRQEEVSVVSKLFLRVNGVPAKYDKLLMQGDIYRWQADARRWSPQRVATLDHAVFGKKEVWGNSLNLLAARGSKRAELLADPEHHRLPPGRYLIKIYLDQEGRKEQDYRYVFGEEELVGEVVFNTRWPVGFKTPTVIRFPQRD